MKVSFGMNLMNSAFGGGNQFGNALSSYLQERDIEVVHHLDDDDIDVIFMVEPRRNLNVSKFGPLEINQYLRNKNPNARVIHRINECQERKGERFLNKFLEESNRVADHTVYIATWLIDLFKKQNLKFSKEHSVILNGADCRIFRPYKEQIRTSEQVFKIVTHHWSANKFKGWDHYEKIDELMEKDSKFKKNFEFHYIGNRPKDKEYKNIIFHDPCNGESLAKELSACDIYLTSTICEPAGMHHIEGAMCGLPLLYRKSGALVEYCNDYGIGFSTFDELVKGLYEIKNNYRKYHDLLKTYDHTAKKMCESYYRLIKEKGEEKGPSGKKLKSDFFYKYSFFKFRLLNKFFQKK